ncbi:MAG: DMT family transporter [Actinomycetota bacterium]
MTNDRRTQVEGSRSRSGFAFGPTLAVLGAATLFGTTGTALAKGPGGIEALSAGSLRLLIGGVGLCIVGRKALFCDFARLRHHRFSLILLGGLTVAAYQLGFFWATETTGVALATVVTIGSSPLVSRLIGLVRNRPAPDRWWVASAIGLILGLVLLVLGSANGTSVDFDALGVLAAVLAGASYAAYTEVGSVMMIRGWHPTSAMAAMFFSAGLLTTPILLVRDLSWVGSVAGISVILYLSLVTLTLAYIWFGSGLHSLAPTTVVMLTMFEPVVAALLAIRVLGETLSALSWFGIALVLVGLVLVGFRSRTS